MKNLLLAITAVASMNMMTAEAQQDVRIKDPNIFNHLDLSITAGTTGVGFDLAAPIGDYVKLRTGFSAMPRFDMSTTYGIQVGDDATKSKSKFETIATRLEPTLGKKVEPKVDAISQFTMWNWNVMVDVYPFKQNKHWRFTGGFYLGPSQVAEAYNTTESMPTLMAVNLYNATYDKLHGVPAKELKNVQIIDLGDDLKGYMTDGEMLKIMQQKFDKYGRMGVKMGTYSRDILDEQGNVIHKEGEKYFLEPDEDCMVKATMHVNRFKPYAGFGYEGRLIKGNDRYHVSFDCGLMFWGGTPELKTHDGTDLIHDVRDVPGRIGSNVRFIEKFKAFPVLNIRLTRKLF